MKPSKPKQKAVKQKVEAKKASPSQKSDLKLLESFIRDLSMESLLPPSLYPRENRDMDFHLAATVRPLDKIYSCVNIAMRVRISPVQSPPFMIFEMIHEGVFEASCANETDAKKLYEKGGPQVFEKARKIALEMFARHGMTPPLPEVVDFSKMWQEGQ